MEDKSATKLGSAEPVPPTTTSPNEDTSAPSNANKSKGPRKRTKTGCLTCRKRRIKCGEEKPRCNNCIKSKRECEGYGQRVVFREPVGPIPHLGPISATQSLSGPGHTFLNRQFVSAFHPAEPPGVRPFLPLAPRPSAYGPVSDGFVAHDYASHAGVTTSMSEEDQYAWHAMQYNQPQQQPTPGYPQGGLDPRIAQFDSTFPIGTGYEAPPYPQTEGYPPQGSQALYGTEFPSSLYVDNTPLSATEPGQYPRPPSGTTKIKVEPTGTGPDLDLGAESDDYYDVDSDEEKFKPDDVARTDLFGYNEKETPYKLMPGADQFFAYNTYDGFLAPYHPSPLLSPLLDPQHFQAFHHFMTVSAPSMSIFERHPYIPSVTLSTGPVPPEQQNLWSYTLPAMALEHPGLLQAMLAYSSYHIARMNDLPLGKSFRHYHYALRKVGRAVGLPNKRKEIATLAATLLLGFFEVMGAEHNKWNSHLAGATQLVREIDFAALTREIRTMRARARAEQWQMQEMWPRSTASYLGSYFENDIFAPVEFDIDMDLVQTITGKAINYDEYGHVGSPTRKRKRDLTAKDVDDYRVWSDLYWWYCKQDAFHSMITGHALLLPYNRWAECPPRAGVGKLDASYGSMDHLILLLARICTFVFKDRKRKLKVIDANGGEWRPPPNFFPPGMGGPPGGPPGAGPPGSGRPPGPPRRPSAIKRDNSPPMYGMVPPSGPIRLPSAFGTTYPSPPSPSNSDPTPDLDMLTAEAEAEWRELVHACEEFERAMHAPGFVPLPPDSAPPIMSPFGPTIQYRTHVVACIWAFYYTIRIILMRAHPGMPPAATVAAGVAASRTAPYAQLIGRIAAGIHHLQPLDVENPSLHPTTVGVLNEMMLPLFFAGVQYVDAAQRAWTIDKLRAIASVTGGSSSMAVAAGCETSWVNALKHGRGPPYTRTVIPLDQQNKQASLSETVENRRFVTVPEGAKMSFAFGLLSLEENVRDPSHNE